MGSETAPTRLSRAVLVAVVDRHAKSKSHSGFQCRETQSLLGKANFIDRLIAVASDNGGGVRSTRGPLLVHDDDVTERALAAAQCIVVKSHCGVTGPIRDIHLH